MSDTVRLETGVQIITIGQLKSDFVLSGSESVFEWLRALVEVKPLLLTSDSGLQVRKAKP